MGRAYTIMTNLQQKSCRTLELHKVLELLAAEAVSPRAKEMALALEPEDTLFACQRLQQQTDDAVRLAGLFGSPSFAGVRDVSGALERARVGGFLNMKELLDVAALLRSARLTKNYLEKETAVDTVLDEYFRQLSGNKYLEEKIEQCIVSEEEMADTASSDLRDIRRGIRTAASKIRDVLNRVITSTTNAKVLQDAVITMRDRTELVDLQRELAVHRSTSEALRAQAHEFTNRLHALSGLLQTGHHREAVEYLQALHTSAPLDVDADAVADPYLRAFLAAKTASAQEKGVSLRVGETSWVPSRVVTPVEVTTVLGNLVDNAVDAARDGARPDPRVEVELITDGAELLCTVADSGDGVPAGRSELLAEAIRSADLGPRPDVWVGAEYSAVQAIRDHCQEQLGLGRRRVYALAYWRLNSAEG